MGIQITSSTDSEDTVTKATGDYQAGADEQKPEPAKDEQGETEEKSGISRKGKSSKSKDAEEPEEEADDSDESESEEDEDSESDQDDDNNDEEDDDSREKRRPKKNGFKARIKRFQRRLSEKEQELEYWKRQALQQGKTERGEPDNESQSTQKQESERPKQDDFDSHEEWIEALTDWKLEQREAKASAEKQRTEAQTAWQKQVQSFQERVQDFAAEHDDFEDVVNEVDDVTLSVGLQEALVTSDAGPAVMYALAQDRKELERINKLPPLAAAREIGRLEARFTSQKRNESAASSNKATKAPPPPKSVGARSSKATRKSIYDPDLSQAEYERLRLEQLSRR